jgi:ATP-dependent RNA helicase DeaD
VYVHRIGRTGRVGRSGRAITLVTPRQRRDLEAVRRHANTEIDPWSANGGPPTPAEDEGARREEREPRAEREARRPRHTKPRRRVDEPRAKLVVGAGRALGLEPADIVSAVVDNSHLDGEDVSNVRVLERFSFVEVPGERAPEVVEKVNGQRIRGVELRVEVAGR